eukprot:4565613-Amphidinium_carterae.1
MLSAFTMDFKVDEITDSIFHGCRTVAICLAVPMRISEVLDIQDAWWRLSAWNPSPSLQRLA